MKQRLSKREKYLTVVLLAIFVIVYFFSFIEYTYRIPILVGTIVMCVFFLLLFREWRLQITTCRIIWGITICIILLEMRRCIVPDLHGMLYFSLVLLILLIFKKEYIGTLNCILNIVYIMGLFFAIFTIVPIILPNIYVNLIVPLMRTNGNFDVIFYLGKGFYSGLTNQASINAVYLSFGVGACFLLLLLNNDKKKRIIYLIILIFELFCILLTSKRGPFLYSLLSMLIVLYFNSERGKKIRNLLFLVLVLTSLFFIIYYSVPSFNMYMTTFLEGKSQLGDFSNGRFALYDAAWNFFKDNKAYGIGWTNFRYIYFRYIDVHNVYLQLLCENGILGAIPVYISFVFCYIFTICKIKDIKKMGGVPYKLILFSLYMQTFFLFHSLTSNALYDYYISYFYFLAILIVDNVWADRWNKLVIGGL